MKKTITILGSTGSVGVNTLRVIREHRHFFKVDGLAANSNLDLLKEQIREFAPRAVYLKDAQGAGELSKLFGRKIKIFTEKARFPKNGNGAGALSLGDFSAWLGSDVLMAATTGTSALGPVLHALENGKKVALANKEILVMAGVLVMKAAKKGILVPVDSEHNAIFQCLQGSKPKDLRKIILTGSGGPLRKIPQKEFTRLSKETVINHPRWKMGQKISVDSATLMNKGLEIIEASWLFEMPVEKIEVLIHPEAAVHSMVEFKDGSILAQAGVTDMRLPISHALSFPERLTAPDDLCLDFAKVSSWTFEEPDRKKFPCLDLAYQAAKKSGSAPCVLGAADEVVVRAFLDDKIDFVKIPKLIEKVLSRHRHVENPRLSEIHEIHDWAVQESERLCQAG